MRIWFVAALLVVGASSSCERPDSDAPSAAPATARSTTRPASPTTADVRIRQVIPTTEPATTRASTADPNDPLASPGSAMEHLFGLMQKRDVTGVRAMMADPKPADEIGAEIAAVANRLESGAKWAIVDTYVAGQAAIVIFRTTFADGKDELSPLFFVNRYDRWKVMLGQTNFKRFTEGEKDNLKKVIDWGAKRMQELRPTTAAATQKTGAATTPKTGAATTPKTGAATPKSP